jgi:hypothetical protein
MKREIVYRDAYIPGKGNRVELRRESIPVDDAVRLAQAACRQEAGAK